MASHYSVVQYVPDSVIDERVNIGVIVFDENVVLSRFLSDWRRVHAFGGEDVKFLKDFASEVVGKSGVAQKSLREQVRALANDDILGMAESWSHAIQLTTPRGSTLDVEGLLVDVASRFLHRTKPRAVTPKVDVSTELKQQLQSLVDSQQVVPDHTFKESASGVPRQVAYFANHHANVALDILKVNYQNATSLIRAADAEANKIHDIRASNDLNGFITLFKGDIDAALVAADDQAEKILTSAGAKVIRDPLEGAKILKEAVVAPG